MVGPLTRQGRTPTRARSRRVFRRPPAAVVLAVAVVTAGSLVGQVPAYAAKPKPATLSAQQTPSVHGTRVVAKPRPADLSQGAKRGKSATVTWPAAGSAEAVLTTDPTERPSARTAGVAHARAGGLPVWVSSPAGATDPSHVSRARVSLLPRASAPAGWRNGLLLRVARTDRATSPGRANVSIDYSGFAAAFGGDWAGRLRLFVLPECALTTPGAKGCQAQPLNSHNDVSARRVDADVQLAPAAPNAAAAGTATAGTLMALAAGPSGDAGTYTATPLQASSTWQAGGNSGDFSWNYPLRTPPSLGGPAPTLSLAYSSSTVDGRSEVTNNQPSWVGEGFDYWPGYIERRYANCADDMGSGANNTTETGDLCWGTDNATMSLNGRSVELIRDTATGAWRLKDDDASKVERLTNTVNGDNDNEYWKLTASDGTQYFFGRNRLPGYTGTAPANTTTNSTWTVPVAGNNSGEPCHQSGFTASFCAQAWRWNLDYVVDPHGNTMSLWYTSETNRYARNITDTDTQTYTRGGALDHIDYGTDNRSGTDTDYTTTSAPMRVAFGAADRCLSSCSTHDVTHWPDTPWDQDCSGSSCPGLYSPTFWTTKRLGTVTTKVWDATASRYKDVDVWTLTHNFPDPGDGTRAGLWLESIVHTGAATGPEVTGAAVTLPEVNFDWVQLANRVDTNTDGKPAMNWMRISTIWTDTGGKIDVRYTGPDCVAGSRMPSSPQDNTLRCYPVLEEQPDKSIKTEYFHKYLVTSVTQADRLTGNPDVTTSYEYVGTPAWRHTDDDGITKDNLRTWSDYRGYSQANTRVGDPGMGAETLTETTFFRGMNGDLDGHGGTRSVTLPAIDINGDGSTAGTADARAVSDENAYAGMTRQTTVYNGVESDPVSTTVSEPWQSAPTATRTTGQTTVYARYTGAQTGWAATKLAAGGWRTTRSDSTFDTYGMVTQTDDRGDVAVTGDETCTKTTYTRNTATNLLALVGETDTYALGCTATATSDADVVGMTRTAYDHQAFGAAPTKGEPTQVDVAKAWTQAGGPTWLTQSTSAYDAYGRVTDATDVRGNHTTTAYTPASGGPVTTVATTTPLGTSTSTLEPSWATPTATVDVNGKRTDLRLDALGRLVNVWLANHAKATYPSQPNTQYSYLVRNSGGSNAVTTKKLNANNNYVTGYTLYDGLLRARQTQSMSMAAGNVGTVFTETKYDAEGRATIQNQYFDASVQPSTTLFTILDWQPKTQTVTQYDRANRVNASIFNSAGAEKWRTTTTYGGDRVNVTPPLGGTATTTVADAHGRTTELRQYHNPTDVGSNTRSLYDAVNYHYNRKGQQDQVTDNAGNTWTYTFDLLGRQTAKHDPDAGDSTSTYNDYGDLLTVTDLTATGTAVRTLAYSYDNLGRKSTEYSGSTTGPKLASWAYDPTGAKGQLASSSRWIGTDEYKIKVRGYTPLYQPTGEDYTIPASQTGLAGTYSVTRAYKVDGSPSTLVYPNAGNLGGETLTYTYDDTTGLPEQLKTNGPGLGQYVTNTDYTAFGETSFVQYQLTSGNYVQRAYTYDDATHQLAEAKTVRQLSPPVVDDAQYTYDPAGNITKIVDARAGSATDNQCFGYDYARRLTEAWTPSAGDCTTTKSVTGLGGPAPYWQSWTFDSVGNRKTQTTHASTGDTTATFTYPDAGATAVQPHAVKTVATVGPGVNKTDSYGYDVTGNTTSRPGVAAAQTLTWDDESRLAKTTESAKDTTYIYAADGTRLIMSDPTNTTLYLPGMEVKRKKSDGTVTGTRYYSWDGQTIAMTSTGAGITWLIGDHQGTQQVSIAAGNQAITQRRQTPYGGPRGTNPAWPNQKSFVGGDNDTATGLINIGAREYDAGIGRFVSVDPVLDTADPQQMTGYSYSGDNPVTYSDPTGLMYEDQPASGSTWYMENPVSSGGGMSACSGSSCHRVVSYNAVVKTKHFKNNTTLTVFQDGTTAIDGHGIPAGTDADRFAGLVADLKPSYSGPYQLELALTGACVKENTGCSESWADQVHAEILLEIANNDPNCDANCREIQRAMIDFAGAAGGGEGSMGRVGGSDAEWGSEARISGCGSNSFDGRTPVLMADGTTKPIKDVQVGDRVQSTDPTTETTEGEEVTQLHLNHDTDLADVAVVAADGTQAVLHTTQNHPFWDATIQRWMPAAQLRSGDALHAPSGDTVRVIAVRSFAGLHDMHNLTVAELHTYYVIAANTPVLVHNTCKVPLPTQKIGRTQRLSNAQATDLAKYLGYRPTGRVLRGEKIFTNGKDYIVQDTTSHIGGSWKIARSPEALNSKSARTATTDALLNPIGG